MRGVWRQKMRHLEDWLSNSHFNDYDMDYEILENPSFLIIGVEVRTSSATAGVDIGALWDRFFSGIMNRIPNRIDADMLSIYTDYESDHTGPYTVLVGCRVSTLDVVPEDMTGREIPGGRYAVYRPVGALPQVVLDTWNQVYGETGYVRSFQADYDIYGPATMDPENAQPEICVGVE